MIFKKDLIQLFDSDCRIKQKSFQKMKDYWNEQKIKISLYYGEIYLFDEIQK